ncbi:MAG: hypothetical protein N3I35_06605 [Clostridia bacterium]|nr:hypothetical protein [Clostridia bacterium]
MSEYKPMFGKGVKRKKRKAKNNPRPTDQDCCAITGKPYAELHEVFYGVNRQKSIQYGMQIRLSPEYHRIGANAVHNNPAFDLQLKQEFQKNFEAEHGHDKFMAVFRKNYIGITVEEYKRQGVA